MNGYREAQALKDVLEKETTLLETLSENERQIQLLVMSRNWSDLEPILKEMSGRAEEIAATDSVRHKHYQALKEALGCEADAGFYDVLEGVSLALRRELSELYRRLKIAVSQVRSVTGGIDAYVASTVATMREVLGELYPDQKGRIYSRSGRATRADERAMVLDRHL